MLAATLLAAALLSPFAALAHSARPAGFRAAGGRMMPPAALRCERGNLTSYFGKVIGYKRGKTSTWLKIATDYDTVEEVTVPNASPALYQGQPLSDLRRVESRTGVLRPGMRVTAWVCGDGKTPPLLDWNGAAE